MTATLQLKTAKDLGWQRVLERIAAHCRSEQGTEKVLGIMPLASSEAAAHSASLCAEALEALRLGNELPRSQLPRLLDVLQRVERGAEVEAEELRYVVATVEVASRLEAFLATTSDSYPTLAAALAFPTGLERLARRIDACIEPSGRVRDGASAELKRARSLVRTSRSSLLARLKSLARRYSDVLRDGGPVERDGRYGLAVRSDAHRRVDGIVLGSSSTGATLYVEPPEITQLANALRLAINDVEREIARILHVLRQEVAEERLALGAAYTACVQADALGAIASWAAENRAVAMPPAAEAAIDLRRMRHPLLDEEVVPTSLRLGAGQGLVLSGPNAGGKTVGLTCLGLAVWLVKSGLPLPADEESRVGWFEVVLSDIGDGQSIERSLSSFSAEVELLVAMLAKVGRRSLVLLDELAGGTDPEQGAALAAAILESLLDAGAAVALTTHYERLKEMASESPRIDNASVGFDFENMRPTFEMTQGVPGASSAFVVALRHGLSTGVVERARGLLNAGVRERDGLLEQLAQERADLTTMRSQAEAEVARLARMREQLDQEELAQRERERNKLGREAEKLKLQVQQARSNLRALSQQIAAGKTMDRKRSERLVDEAAAVLSIGSELDEALAPPRSKGSAARDLRLGMRVYLPKLRLFAQIEHIDKKGNVRLQAGAMSLRAKASELEATDKKDKKRSPKGPAVGAWDAAPGLSNERRVRSEANTCNLRGMRVPEALEKLERFVDSLLRSGERYGFALHGHGTGILKKAVREHLETWPLVAKQRAAKQSEGGDAFTLFVVA